MSDVYIPPGRPSRLTPERADKIVELIGQGHYNRTAALAVGIGQRTVQRWLARGEAADDRLRSGQPIEADDERYWHFWQRVQQAESAAVDAALAAIRQGWQRDNQWTAAAWYLERKYPGEWGRRQEVSVGPNDRMLEILATAISVGGEEDAQPGSEPGTTVTAVAPEALEPPE
jgi:transposase